MITAIALVAMMQVPVVVGERPEVVGYELQTMTHQQYVPVVRNVPVVTYSAPVAYYYEVGPLVRGAYPLPLRGKTVIKDRWPGFRGKTVIRN